MPVDWLLPGTTTQNRRAKHLKVCRSQKRYNFFLANNLLIAKFPRPILHTSITVDKLNKSWTCKRFHVGAAVGMLVVLLLLPLSPAINDSEFDHDGGGGGGGGPAAAAASAVAAVADDWRRKRPAMRAWTVA
jgi:hypothetical protein